MSRLPRWAERALQTRSDERRNEVMGSLLGGDVWVSLPEQATIAHYLRGLGWSGDHKDVALAEAVTNDRSLSPNMVRELLRQVVELQVWEQFVLGDSSVALSALWSEATRTTSNDKRIDAALAARLSLVSPPPNLRERALQWLSEFAQDEDWTNRIWVLRGIAIAAEHPGRDLSMKERAMLRDAVEWTLKTRQRDVWIAALAFEALDALDGPYAVDVWQ